MLSKLNFLTVRKNDDISIIIQFFFEKSFCTLIEGGLTYIFHQLFLPNYIYEKRKAMSFKGTQKDLRGHFHLSIHTKTRNICIGQGLTFSLYVDIPGLRSTTSPVATAVKALKTDFMSLTIARSI
jgi:hypothetical protein